ncbi:MAG: hypothetical protein QXZ09_07900 [Candidatus Methanomethylicaceae archaeon]
MLRVSQRKWARNTDIVCAETRFKRALSSSLASGRGKLATWYSGFVHLIPYCEEATGESFKNFLINCVVDELGDFEYDCLLLAVPKHGEIYKYENKRLFIVPDWVIYVPRRKHKPGVPYSLRQVADACALLSLVARSVFVVMPRRWYLYDETYSGQIAEAMIRDGVLTRKILRFSEPLFHDHKSLEVLIYV